jgi:hypothetical protein
MDVTVVRNAFGRQFDSFEADLQIEEIPASRIRRLYPRPVDQGSWSRRQSPARIEGRGVVAARQGTCSPRHFIRAYGRLTYTPLLPEFRAGGDWGQVMNSVRSFLPTDLPALVAVPGLSSGNEAWPRERMGAGEAQATLSVVKDQLLSFTRHRGAWLRSPPASAGA